MSAQDAAYVHDPRLSRYELGPDHPFRPERQAVVTDLLRSSGLLPDDELIGLDPFDADELTRVHAPDYVRAVRTADDAGRLELLRFGLGTLDTPVFPDMHEAVARVVASTVTAVEAVASGRARRAASFAGGLHHAMPDRAAGFCVYNDLAVAIRRAVDRHGVRVAYLDVDAHHGDGVQAAFYEDPDVLTLSLHETGRTLFPGTGFTHELGRGRGLGTSLNVPLEPYTEDEGFLRALDVVAPRALEAFRPDLLVLQAGADMHRDDPLAHLSLSLQGLVAGYRRAVELADAHAGGRLVVTGGGGYRPFETPPRAWAHLWAAMTGRELPARLPETWRERWAQAAAPAELPRDAWEPPHESEDATTELWTRGRALATARALLYRWEATGAGSAPS